MSLGRRWPAGWALNLLAVLRLLSAWGGGTSASPALTLHADPAVPAMSTSFRSPEWVPPVWGSWTRSGEQVPGQWPLEGPGGNMVTTGVGGVMLQPQAVPAPSHPCLPDPQGSLADGEGPQLCLQPLLAPGSWAGPGPGPGGWGHTWSVSGPRSAHGSVWLRSSHGSCLGVSDAGVSPGNCRSPQLREAAGAGGFGF